MRIINLILLFVSLAGLLFCEVTFSDSMFQSAKAGNAEAQYSLGVCYQNGYGVKADLDEAVKWYQLAAKQGLAAAQYALGNYYKEGKKEVAPSSQQPRKDLGNSYKEKTINYPEAIKWFRLAAEQGDAAAQFSLGECYYYGNGVGKDIQETLRLCRLAAQKNYPAAENRIGECYRLGEGVIQNYTEAEKWFLLSARHGSNDAIVNLANMYFSEYDVKDRVRESYFWWLIAAAKDVKGAQINRDNVGLLLCKAEKDVIVVKATKWLDEQKQ